MGDCQRSFTEEEIRRLMYQMLQGLSHMHGNGYFHRDLKPGMNFSQQYGYVDENIFLYGKS